MRTGNSPKVLLVLLLVLALVAAACGGDDDDATGTPTGVDPDELREGGTVTFANDQEPTGWNINTASDNLLALGIMVQHVYPSTFLTTPDFEVVLDEELMVSAEQVEDDPQTIEYVIRDEAVWSDGEPISGDDFVYMWEQTINPDNDVASTVGYEDIESVTPSEDGKTVTVVFAQPFAEWKGLFDDILPAHIMNELEGGWNDGLDGENIPEFSGGPFMFEDYRPEQSIRMVRNENYWGQNKPRLDEVVVRFGIDADAIPAALENGEIDVAYPQPQRDLVAQVERLAPDIEHEISLGLSFEHIDFDLENPFLQDLAVRQAIAYAVDEEELVNRTVRQFTDDAAPLYNRLYVNDQPQYEEHGEEYQGVDVDKAKETLEAAGFAEGSDGIYEKDGQRLSLRISTTGGNALREDTEEVIQSQMREAGIDIQIDNEDGSAVFGRFFPDSPEDRDFDIALFAWVNTPFASDNKALYTTGSGSNEMFYSNEEVDELFDQVIREIDEDEATRLYNRIDEIMWDDLPTIPLYAKPTFLPFRSTVANVIDNASTAGPLWNMYDWGLKTE